MDIRTQKTRALIANTFLSLLKEKPIDRISVAELTSQAHINRSTFYRHYTDIYNLRDTITTEFSDEIVAHFEEHLSEMENGEYRGWITELLDYVSANKEVIILTNKNTADPTLVNQLRATFIDKIFHYQNIKVTRFSRIIATDYCVSGTLSLVYDWITGKLNVSEGQLVEDIDKFIGDVQK
ncbi:TetR/AcrR family transcriptional regulator [Secundilactobacillus collinoides]|uniref:HTH tetR-type domain-containing protein n=1 Tax=Secundilactobacillus collinoides DSM 20515 = JCM 1123 TaxID=1423733 RepID=A0A0R2BCW6_SECCO|nr:TetR/AcrR family transcriptional regulator [Secundilactobacillus collinoides]KRM74411.1 hypothetical protein FC82_GL000169 [Secundilactobacillus collinoides DSM 20515 = JCM 1123]